MKGPTRSARQVQGGWLITVTPPKWSTFKPTSIMLNDAQKARYDKWLRTGCMIQDALPDLSPEQREVLISGISPEEWDRIA
jgi:hypothetical protein